MEFISNKLNSSIFINELYSIYNLTFAPHFKFEGETHNFWEISYVMEGTVGFTLNDQLYNLSEGYLIIVKPNVFHKMWIMEEKEAKCFTFSFSGAGLENISGNFVFFLNNNDAEKILLSLLIKEIPLFFKNYNIDGYTNIEKIAPDFDGGYQVIKNYIELIILYLNRKNSIIPYDLTIKKSEKFTKIINFLKDNVQKNLTLKEIAYKTATSQSDLKLIFSQYVGMGIIKFYNKMRLDYCIYMMKNGVSFNEIAEKMNFSSQNYFNFFFKRETKMTPTEYIKHIKSG